MYFFYLILFLLAHVQINAEEVITLLGSQYPNHEYTDPKTGKIEGSSVEILKLMCKRAGLKCIQKITNWSVASQRAMYEKNVGVHSMLRSTEREENYQWVGPLYEDKILLIARRDHTINPTLLLNIVGAQVGYYSVSLLQAEGFIVKQYKDYAKIFQAMKDGEIDLAEVLMSVRKSILQDNGQDPKDFKRVHMLDKTFGLYLGFSTDTNKAVIKKLQSALDSIRKEGLDKPIYEKYDML